MLLVHYVSSGAIEIDRVTSVCAYCADWARAAVATFATREMPATADWAEYAMAKPPCKSFLIRLRFCARRRARAEPGELGTFPPGQEAVHPNEPPFRKDSQQIGGRAGHRFNERDLYHNFADRCLQTNAPGGI
jgi:hypothetical protein